jgi:hypothetical protein
MRKYILCLSLANSLFSTPMIWAQSVASKVETHIRHLASDRLLGRKTGHWGCDSAAAYIVQQFETSRVKPLSDKSYVQSVPFVQYNVNRYGKIAFDSTDLHNENQFIILNGDAIPLQKMSVVMVPYAEQKEDYAQVDVKGKVVLTQTGGRTAHSVQAMLELASHKRHLAESLGAIAILEVFRLPATPWRSVRNNLGAKKLKLLDHDRLKGIAHCWIDGTVVPNLLKSPPPIIELAVAQENKTSLASSNVIGWIEGNDPDLKKQIVVLSAHYDHLGFGGEANRMLPNDTIFNGARDNALGVAALLSASERLAHSPPKRSVLLIAFTGEELGGLGSKYFVQHSPIALQDIVFNLNCDGAGFSDTTLITLVGKNYTQAGIWIESAMTNLNLKTIDDPTPEQNLFERSDNVAFALNGIPCATFSPGFRAFDEKIGKYYHNVRDNPDDLDYRYAQIYADAFVVAARLLADAPHAPQWILGNAYQNKDRKDEK